MASPPTADPLPGPPLIGREAERDALAEWLARGAPGLLTITGPPGVGKTALAAAIASGMVGAGRQVVWVDLSDVTRPELGRAALREALGIPSDLPPEVPLGSALTGAPPELLVIDGMDALASTLASELAALARGLGGGGGAVLVTSGRRLHLPDEETVALAGLAPEDGARLFARFAGAVDDAVAERISESLGGLPLALALAGARAATLGARAVAARLDDALALLAAPLAGAPPRHRSVRAAMDVAWGLVPPAGRRALAACAAFAGPFDVAAAEAAIGPPDPLAALSELVDGSWLRVVEDRGERRFRVPPLVRSYAVAAAPGAAAAARDRLARWLAGRAEAAWRGAERGDRRRWRREVDDVAAELWRVAAEAAEPADRVHAALALALVAEDRDTTTQLDCASLGLAAGAEGELAARLLELRARARRDEGRPVEALADLEEAARVARGTPAFPLVLAQRAVARAYLEDLDGAVADAAAAERALDAATPPFVRLLAGATAAVLDYQRGEMARAEPALERALGQALALDAGAHAAELAGILGNLAHRDGRLGPARERLAAARDSAAGEGAARLAAIFEGYVALVDHEAGRAEDALAGYERAVDALARFASRRHEALFRAARAALLAALGRDPEGARRDLALAAHLATSLEAPALDAAVAVFRQVARARWDGAAPVPVAAHGAPNDDDLIVARRIAAQALGALGAAPVLAVASDTSRVRLGAVGDVVDLSRRAPLRRVLAALVTAHGDRPGALVSAEALQAAGWPGERMLPEAGRQRVRVAVWTLRKLGLKPVIETEGAAYRLRANVVLGPLREV